EKFCRPLEFFWRGVGYWWWGGTPPRHRQERRPAMSPDRPESVEAELAEVAAELVALPGRDPIQRWNQAKELMDRTRTALVRVRAGAAREAVQAHPGPRSLSEAAEELGVSVETVSRMVRVPSPAARA